jgi:hypothetical protein
MPTSVTKPELEELLVEDDEPVDPPVDVPVDVLEVAAVAPPPETDCPTMPLTDATVPLTGARSVV